MPIRAPKTPIVEQEDTHEHDRSASSGEEDEEPQTASTQRESLASILAAGPRQLEMPSSVDFGALYSSPRKLMAQASVDSEVATPLEGLTKKVENLRRKSIARQSLGGDHLAGETPKKRTTPFLVDSSPFRLGTPSRQSNAGLATPAPVTVSLSQISTQAVTEDETSFELEQGPVVAAPASPQPIASSSLSKALPASRPKTAAPPVTPHLKGVRDLFKTPYQAISSLDAHFTGVRSMFAPPTPIQEDPQSPSAALSAGDLGVEGVGLEAELEHEVASHVPEDLLDEQVVEQEEEMEEQEEALPAEEDPAGDETEDEEEDMIVMSHESELAGEEQQEEDAHDEEDEVVVEISPKRPARATKPAATSSRRARAEPAPVPAPAPTRRGRTAALKSSTSSVDEAAPKPRLARGRKAATPKVEEDEHVLAEQVPAPKATRARKAAAPKKAAPVVEESVSEEEEEEQLAPAPKPRARRGAASPVEEVPAPPARKTRTTAAKVESTPPPAPKPVATTKTTRTTKRAARTPSPAPEPDAEDPIDSIGPDEPTTPAQPTVRAARRRVASKEEDESAVPVVAAPAPPARRGRPVAAKAPKAEAVEQPALASTSSTRSRNALSASKVAASAPKAIEVVPVPKTRRAAASRTAVVQDEADGEDKENAAPVPTRAAASKAKGAAVGKTASATKVATRKAPAVAAVVDEPKVTRATRSRK